MAKFGFKSEPEAPKTSGAKMKLLVRVAGLAVIGGIFLNFLLGTSILEWVENVPPAIDSYGLGGAVENIFGGTSITGTLTRTLILLGFVFIPLLGLSMLLRGKYKGGQLTFLIVFNLGAFLMVNFFGLEAGVSGNFFVNTGIGYWISCAGLFLPFVGMIFLDESI